MTEDVVKLNELFAVVGLKIQETDLELAEFPKSDYARGERDMAVNILAAIRKMQVLKVAE